MLVSDLLIVRTRREHRIAYRRGRGLDQGGSWLTEATMSLDEETTRILNTLKGMDLDVTP